jgi:membrane fusion protein, adhesin transport system
MAALTALADPTPFTDRRDFAALDAVRTGGSARWFGRFFLALFLLLPFLLLFVPWQQTVRGRGQIIAYAPTERRQVVTALVSGQVKTWHVWEQKRVKAGDPIADIDDNDPGLAGRLEKQREFLYERRAAAQLGLDEQSEVVTAQTRSKDAAVAAAKASRDATAQLVDVAKEAKKNNEFAAAFEKLRFEMFDKLHKNPLGLESGLNRDEAKARADRATTDVKRAEAEIKRSQAAVLTAASVIDQAEATGLSAVASARRDLQTAEQNLFAIDQQLQELDTRIERFKARFVRSPVDGVVLSVSANANNQYVKEGDELAVIVPDATDRVVELLIGGVDAPLIAAHMQQNGNVGPHVRLQFEGWPAVQFTGWPSVAVGTFGGRVRQMDPADDGFGKFRILVEPEEMFPGDTWPEGEYLRQGNQAVGWVFLNRVTVGYELWRTFNGFPPVVAPKAPDKTNKDDSKPPKVKPG